MMYILRSGDLCGALACIRLQKEVQNNERVRSKYKKNKVQGDRGDFKRKGSVAIKKGSKVNLMDEMVSFGADTLCIQLVRGTYSLLLVIYKQTTNRYANGCKFTHTWLDSNDMPVQSRPSGSQPIN